MKHKRTSEGIRKRNEACKSLRTGLYVTTPKFLLGDSKEGARPLIGAAVCKCETCGTSLTAFDLQLHICVERPLLSAASLY